VIQPACALELIHTYSLVHDDLPAMDDDDLRRGRATLHRRFGEAEAILAGDAMLTLAFEILGTHPAGAAQAVARADAVRVAARGAGLGGMVGGQIADIEAERRGADAERLGWIHRHKTGALFAACAEIGALHAGADAATCAAASRYGTAFGLAFQITDDVLDCTASAEALGKTPGKDDRAGKATYPALYGLERAQRLAQEAADAAARAAADLAVRPAAAARLLELARLAVDRRS
jgi:geranylgeranyl diphosphate synthase type II